MSHITRNLAVALALAVLLALPIGALAGTATSKGATVNITGAHLIAKVAVVVDVDLTCDPINGNEQLVLGEAGGLNVTVYQTVGKKVASGTGWYSNPSSPTILCDGSTVHHLQVNVVPSGNIPFAIGHAAMDAQAVILDFTTCCPPPDVADTGLIALRITH